MTRLTFSPNNHTYVLHNRDQISAFSPKLAALLAKMDGASNCWEWPGWRDPNGYGQSSWRDHEGRQRKTTAHRLAYVLSRGSIPVGWPVDHLCRNRSCFNPGHLEPVPPVENLARAVGNAADAVRSKLRTGSCAAGHAEWNAAGQCAACIRDRLKRNRARRQAAADRLGLSYSAYVRLHGHALAVADAFAGGPR